MVLGSRPKYGNSQPSIEDAKGTVNIWKENTEN